MNKSINCKERRW